MWPIRVVAASVVVVAVLLAGSAASAQDDATTTSTTLADSATSTSLPGTSLQAGDSGRGEGALAPWVIGGGIAALALVLGGGWLLHRRSAPRTVHE